MDKIDFGEGVQLAVAKYLATDPDFASACNRLGIEGEYFGSRAVAGIVDLAIKYFRRNGKVPGPDMMAQLLADAFAEKRRGFREEDLELYAATLPSVLNANHVGQPYLLDRLKSFVHIRVVDSMLADLSRMREKRGWDSSRMVARVNEAIAEINSKTDESTVESFMDDVREDGYGDVVCKTNIPNIDRQLGGGLKIGNFVVIVAYLNVGKSWSAIHLAKMAARLGNSSLIIDLERPNNTLRTRLRMSMTGMTPEQINRQSGEARDILQLSMVKNSKIFLLNDEEKEMDVDRLPTILDDIENKYGIRPKLVIFDSADDLSPPQGLKTKEERDRLSRIYVWLKNYSKEISNNLCIATTTQAQRKAEGVEWIKASNVGEDINKLRKATVGISLNAKQDEINKGLIRFSLFKNTDGPVGAKAWGRTNFNIGQLFTTVEPYNATIYREVLRLADQSKTARRHF